MANHSKRRIRLEKNVDYQKRRSFEFRLSEHTHSNYVSSNIYIFKHVSCSILVSHLIANQLSFVPSFTMKVLLKEKK